MQVNGIVVITDMKDFSLSQFQWLLTHPGALKERITSIQDGVPMRIKVKWLTKSGFSVSLSVSESQTNR